MVRATYARVLVRLGGTRPVGWDEADITSLCTQADYVIDGFTYPDTISTTSDVAIELAVDVVLRMMRQADMMRRSAGASQGEGFVYPDLTILTDELISRIRALLNTTHYAVVVIDGLGSE